MKKTFGVAAVLKAFAFTGLLGCSLTMAACSSADGPAAQTGPHTEQAMDEAIASVRANPDAIRSIQLKIAQGGLDRLSEADFEHAKALAKRSSPLAADWDALSLSDLRQASGQMRDLAATATPSEFSDYVARAGLTARAAGSPNGLPGLPETTKPQAVGAFVVGGAAFLFLAICWSAACYWNGDGLWC